MMTKTMYKIILLLLLILPQEKIFAQEVSQIDKKYDFVEVWGLNNQSRTEFLREIISLPEGICEQSLTKMGFTDGNKFPIPFSNKIIITLRTIPEFKSKYENEKIEDKQLEKWNKFKVEYDKLGDYERQQVPSFIDFYLKNDRIGFNSMFVELSSEFKGYGIDLDKNKIIQALDIYIKYSEQFSKNEILIALYSVEKIGSVQELAVFIAPKYLKNEEDLLDFLPLLLKKKSGIQLLITAFITHFEGQIDWNKNMDLLTKLINNPNPFQSLLAIKVADKTGFSMKNMNELLETRMQTMEDILTSRFLRTNESDYLVAFLNKYSNLPIEVNKKLLANRLK